MLINLHVHAEAFLCRLCETTSHNAHKVYVRTHCLIILIVTITATFTYNHLPACQQGAPVFCDFVVTHKTFFIHVFPTHKKIGNAYSNYGTNS